MKGVKSVPLKRGDWVGPGFDEVKLACSSLAVDSLSFLEDEIVVGLQYDLCDFTPVLRIRSIADAVIEANRECNDGDHLTVLDAGIDWLLREAMKLQQERRRLNAADLSKPEVAA